MIRVLALTIALVHAGATLAQTEEDPVIAIVNGEAIHNSDMILFYNSLPSQFRQIPMVSLYDKLIDGLLERKLLAQAARAAGMMDDAVVKRRLAYVTDDVLQRTYLDQLLVAEVTEERLRANYEETAAGGGEEEVSARHILLEDEDAALAVIGELAAGGDFASLAKERSTGPSGSSGGDLGYFTRDQMVAPFSEAAFALNPGEYTREPVRTQFGWHVIKVEDRRKTPPPSFEDSRDEISRQMAQEFVLALMAKLRETAEINRLDPPDNEAEAPGAPTE